MSSRAAKSGLAGDAAWALLGQVGSGLALLAGIRVLTEMVSPEVYGEVALLTGIVGLGVTIFAYPLILAGMRLLPECSSVESAAGLRRLVARLTGRMALPVVVLLIAGGQTYATLRELDPWLFPVAALLLAVTMQRELGIQLLIAERRQRRASLWQATEALLRPGLAILAVWLWEPSTTLILAGYAVAAAVTNGLWSLRRERRQTSGDSAASPALIRDLWRYAVPLIPMQILLWISGLGDRYVIGYYLTPADVGLYAAAYTLVNEAFNRSAMVLLRTFQPRYFQFCSGGAENRAFRLLGLWLGCVLLMGIAGTAALYFLADWVARLLLAESFRSAAALMPAIGAGCAVNALAGVLSQPLLGAKRTGLVLIGHGCGAIAAAISLPLLVQAHGLMGAAWAAPVYYGIEALAMALLATPWRVPVLAPAAKNFV